MLQIPTLLAFQTFEAQLSKWIGRLASQLIDVICRVATNLENMENLENSRNLKNCQNLRESSGKFELL